MPLLWKKIKKKELWDSFLSQLSYQWMSSRGLNIVEKVACHIIDLISNLKYPKILLIFPT